MAQPVPTRERRRVAGPRRLDLAQQLRAVVGMDSLEPLCGRAADFMVVPADERDPARREMNPVGFQIPVPERLAVAASALPIAVLLARSMVVHA
jgi:hypothetical protein